MSNRGNYCKAYYYEQLSQHAEFRDAAGPMDAEQVLYVHDNFVVTRGVYREEEVVFDGKSDQWRAYCQDDLKFEVPSYAQADAA